MYPSNVTETAALLGALVPLIVWALSSAFSAFARTREASLARWRRVQELAVALHNKRGNSGLWAQMLAIRELEEMRGRQKKASREVLQDARVQFADERTLAPLLDDAIHQIDRHWLSRIFRV